MKLTEGHIHIAIRRYLKSQDWELIAGQYPGGSDDELFTLNIVDPKVARDRSPDPRGHSKGKIVPDLIAYKDNNLLIIEAKPKYSSEDRGKLTYLLEERLHDLLNTLEKFALERGFEILIPVSKLNIIPALAFSSRTKSPPRDEGFVHFTVRSLTEVEMISDF